MTAPRALAASAVLAALAAAAPAHAAEGNVGVVYDVAFAGLNVAKATLSIALKDGGYTGTVSYRAAGLVGVVGTVDGKVSVAGKLGPKSAEPTTYNMINKTSSTTRKVVLQGGGGALRDVTVEPKRKEGGGRVPITEAMLKGALDPFSAAIAVVPSPEAALTAAACQRKVPIYDGWSRYDVSFSFEGLTKVATEGFTGQGVTCRADYASIGGHRPDSDSTKFWDSNRDMKTTLVQVGSLPLLVPAEVTVKTPYGTVELTVRKLNVSQQRAAAN